MKSARSGHDNSTLNPMIQWLDSCHSGKVQQGLARLGLRPVDLFPHVTTGSSLFLAYDTTILCVVLHHCKDL